MYLLHLYSLIIWILAVKLSVLQVATFKVVIDILLRNYDETFKNSEMKED